MTALDAMRMALSALESSVLTDKVYDAITNLRDAIAEMERAEPVAWVTRHGLQIAQQHEDDVPLYYHPAAPSQEQEQDPNKCPGCGGPADNGHDRCIPQNPYYCTKCTKAMYSIKGVAK